MAIMEEVTNPRNDGPTDSHANHFLNKNGVVN